MFLLPFLLLQFLGDGHLDEVIEDADLVDFQTAVVSVVGWEQAAVKSEPLLAEVVRHQLVQLEVDVVHVSHQLLSTPFLLEH